MATVASFVVPAAAAVLFSATALLQQSALHGLLAVASFIVTAIGVALYIRRRHANQDEEDADDPTTGQVIVLALGCVLVMVWGALLASGSGIIVGQQESVDDYGNMWETHEEVAERMMYDNVPLESEHWDSM